MVISFKENEDFGNIDPVKVKMQNFILHEGIDTFLKLLMQISLLATFVLLVIQVA
jgi:hypothetical protein